MADKNAVVTEMKKRVEPRIGPAMPGTGFSVPDYLKGADLNAPPMQGVIMPEIPIGALAKLFGSSLKVVEPAAPVLQEMPKAGVVDSIVRELAKRLGSVPSAAAPAAEAAPAGIEPTGDLLRRMVVMAMEHGVGPK